MGDTPKARRLRPPWLLADIAGPSMLPNLYDGEQVLAWPYARVRPGDVVVVRRPDRPEVVMVKRVRERVADGWWLLGDNPYRSIDSREFGPVADHLVMGRAAFVRRRGGAGTGAEGASRGRARWRRIGADNPFEG
ncbi:nickel-type superoxide dismutase maturation protease [Yinghuangia seranimata]|uniref:nickel-type superoxide dismutase maturation protease n=1 Tax=Yinghuangia seranimata TaxID=408067 RepID=UPI00248C74CA|nr:nickel-type superoxide dismutase maturation protease [Yinghuangia seranimata]MDI2128097.1 nickel-type superoxide dismutase maturation protease [Yinghuangia seranimata]